MSSRPRRIVEAIESDRERHGPDLLRKIAADLRVGKRSDELRCADLLDEFARTLTPGALRRRQIELRNERDQHVNSADRMIRRQGSSLPERLDDLRAELRRYERIWDRVDRHRGGATPANYAGTVHEHLFAAYEANRKLKATWESGADIGRHGAFPTSVSALRRMLSDCSVDRTPANNKNYLDKTKRLKLKK